MARTKFIHHVFITINNLNGMRCVSLTSKERNSPYLGSSSYLKDAIKEYGRENFTKVLVGSYATREKAHDIEALMVKELGTVWPNGYNNSPTGGTGPGIGEHSEGAKKKMSASIKIAMNRPEVKAQISANTKKRWEDPKEREKMSATMKIAMNRQEVREKRGKPVAQYALDGTFLQTFIGAWEAMFQTGAQEQNITMCCKGRGQSAGGFQWRYYEGNTDDIEPIQPSNHPMRNLEVAARVSATKRENFRHDLMVRTGQILA